MKIGFSVVHASEVTTFPLSNLQEILPISRNRSKEIGFVEDPPHFFSIILDLTNIIFEALLNGLDELGETFWAEKHRIFLGIFSQYWCE